MLWVVFNKEGQWIAQYNVGNTPVAGTNEFQIFAYFKDLSNAYNGASMKLYKPDLEEDSYVPLLMNKTSAKYEGTTNDNLTNNETYNGFLFDFSQVGVPSLLDTAGIWKAVITLYATYSANVRNVVGMLTFEVGNGISTEHGTEIPDEEVISQIYAALAAKLDINGVNEPQYIKVINDADIANYDFSTNFRAGDFVLNKNDNKLYKLDANKAPVLTNLNLNNLSANEISLISVLFSRAGSDFQLHIDGEGNLVLESNDFYIILNEASGELSITSASLTWNGKNIATENIVFIDDDESTGTFDTDEYATLLKDDAIVIAISTPAPGARTDYFYVKESIINPTSDANRRIILKRTQSPITHSYGTYSDYQVQSLIVAADRTWNKGTSTIQFYSKQQIDANFALIDETLPKVAYDSAMTFRELYNISNEGCFAGVIQNGIYHLEPTFTGFYVCVSKATGYYYGEVGVDTTLSQFFDNTVFHTFETRNNKVTAISDESTNEEYPSAKCVWNMIQGIKREEMVVIDDEEAYPTLQDFLDDYDGPEEGTIYLYPVSWTESEGYYQYIYEDDYGWVGLGSTEIDVSNFYTKSQTDTLLDNKADKEGPLPSYSVSDSTDMVAFIQSNNLKGKPFVFKDLSGNSYLAWMNTIEESLLDSFVFQCISLGSDTIYRGMVSVLHGETLTATVSTILSNTYKYDIESTRNKVTSLSGSSTNYQYPSAKLVYDQLALKADKAGPLPSYSVSNSTDMVDFINDNSLNDKPFIVNGYLTHITYTRVSSGGLTVDTVQFRCIALRQSYSLNVYEGEINYEPIGSEVIQVPLSTMLSSTYLKKLEVSNNKVTSISSGSTNTQYPSAKAVWNLAQDVREVAEGKCRTFVMDATQESLTESYFTNGGVVYKTNGDAITTWNGFKQYVKANDQTQPIGTVSYICSNSQLNISSNDTLRAQIGKYVSLNEEDFEYFYLLDMDNVVIVYNDEHVRRGDVFLIKQLSVPDRWFSGYQNYSGGEYDSGYYIKLEALEAKTNLTNYYAKNASLVPTINNTYDIGSSSYTFKNAYLGGKVYSNDYQPVSGNDITIGNGNGTVISRATIRPTDNNARDLGTSSYYWKDIYLAGKVIFNSANNDIHLYSNSLVFKVNGNDTYVMAGGYFSPNSNGSVDLGLSSFKWKDLYLSGSLSDGTYSYTIASSYKMLFGLFFNNDNITALDYEVINICSKTADTTFTFRAKPLNNTYPEYKAIITNSHQTNAITLTFTSVTKIICNDDNCVVNGNAITIPSGTTIEVSVMNGNLIAFNWQA